ncbi:MAG: GNAT family N-acetyltransferase [Pacificimonas sp.]
MTDIIYRQPQATDLDALCQLARDTFTETFGDLYSAEDLHRFLDDTFGPTGLPVEFADPAYSFRVAEADGQLIAYCKVGPPYLPSADDGRAKIELRQLYVRSPWHGSGVAATLMHWALGIARGRDYDDIYLSVFSDNIRAQKFYARYGFEEVGKMIFMVGEHEDDERIWRLKIR